MVAGSEESYPPGCFNPSRRAPVNRRAPSFTLSQAPPLAGFLAADSQKRSARELAELYADRGGDIFHRSLWDKVTTIDGLSNPDYDPRPLETILRAQLG